jgi:hypothetical protein
VTLSIPTRVADEPSAPASRTAQVSVLPSIQPLTTISSTKIRASLR